jgi:DNA-binding beta-propeller fold protein YncE
VLPGVRTAFEHVSGPPFGIATTEDGRWSFVDELGGRVAVFSDGGLAPLLVRTIHVPEDAVGNSLTRDGRYLLVADGVDGATVVSVARAESGASDAVLGTLTERARRIGGGGAIEAIASPDGRYAFVSIEYGDVVAVYDLSAARADGFRTSSYLGSVPLGRAVVGLAVSPDGRWLYATSELAADARPAAQSQGTLSVIALAQAVRHPARSLVVRVPAHCSPVSRRRIEAVDLSHLPSQ